MSLPVVADADTLFTATTRGLLIYLDYEGLVRLHWSPLILDELGRALVDAGRKKTAAETKAHEKRMRDALPNAMVGVPALSGRSRVEAHGGELAGAAGERWSVSSGSCARCRAASRRRRDIGCLPAGKAYLDAPVAT